MPVEQQHQSQKIDAQDRRPELLELVVGLHWDPPLERVASQPADLDVLCVLFDSTGNVLEVVHPGRPRSADSSVVHTGDSRTGASAWDDERIFVFLEALPKAAAKLAFYVLSSTGHTFDEVPGAFCHVSDLVSEARLAYTELTSLSGQTAHTVAVLRRDEEGWKFVSDGGALDGGFLAELRTLVTGAK